MRWSMVVLAALIAGAAFGVDFLEGKWKIVSGVAGVLLVILQAYLGIRAETSRREARIERAVEMTDVWAPLLKGFKDIRRDAAKPERQQAVAGFISSAVGGCTGLTEADRTRATVYHVVNRSGTRVFVPWRSTGRGDAPVSQFEESPGTEGASVWEYARNGEARFVKDIREEQIPNFDRQRKRRYRTFITVPIILDDQPVGLLTINVPEPGDLLENDVETMLAIADLIAAALRHAGNEFPSNGA